MMYTLGKTSTEEILGFSQDRVFILNEYLEISDKENKNPICEVIETYSYKKCYDDLIIDGLNLSKSLSEVLGFDKEKDLYIAKFKILGELNHPVRPLTEIKIPNFLDIENLLINSPLNRGFLLGITRGTSHMLPTLPEKYKDVCKVLKDGDIQEQDGVPFILDAYSQAEYPHIGFFGGSGSGKTFGQRVLTEEIMKKKIPGLIADAHFEFSYDNKMPGVGSSIDYSDRCEIFTIGKNCGINFCDLNTGELMKLISFVGQLSQPMIGAIEALHSKGDTYQELARKVEELRTAFENEEKSKKDKEPLSEDSVLLFQKYKNKISGKETLQAVMWRLEALNKMNIFKFDASPIESCLLRRKLAILRSPSYKILTVYISYVVGKMYKKRRSYKDGTNPNGKFPPFFVMLDEAHIYAPKNGGDNPTKSLLRELGQEARKYGVFLVVGTQRPSLLDPDLFSQLSTKIIFRTQIESDMEMIRSETGLNEHEFSILSKLTAGHAFVSSATLSKVFYIKFRCSETKSAFQVNPFDELKEFGVNERLQYILKSKLPINVEQLGSLHGVIEKEYGSKLLIEDITNTLEDMVNEGVLIKEKTPFSNRYMLNRQ